MTKRYLVPFLLSSVAFGLFENQFLSLEQAQARWGRAAFSVEKFRTGSPDDRASMVVELIAKDRYTGKKLSDVKKELGPADGKYESSKWPAYRLGADSQNVYLLVFLPEYTGKQVESVKIYRQPLEHPGESVSVGTARLPMTIDGPAAAKIYRYLSVPEEKDRKAGKSVSCTHEGDNYRCSFELDSEGTAFPR